MHQAPALDRTGHESATTRLPRRPHARLPRPDRGARRADPARRPHRPAARRGRPSLSAGRRLRPQDVGLLASSGVAEVSVIRRPCVAIVITGDELLPPGSHPEGYRIVDSNSLMLAALVQRDGGEVVAGPIVPDRREA